MRPGARTGSSPLDAAVRKVEAGALTRDDACAPEPRTAGNPRSATEVTAPWGLRGGLLTTRRGSPPAHAAHGAGLRGAVQGLPQTRPARGKDRSRGPRRLPRHSGGTNPVPGAVRGREETGPDPGPGLPRRPGDLARPPPACPGCHSHSAWRPGCPHPGSHQREAEPTRQASGSLTAVGRGGWRLSKHNRATSAGPADTTTARQGVQAPASGGRRRSPAQTTDWSPGPPQTAPLWTQYSCQQSGGSWGAQAQEVATHAAPSASSRTAPGARQTRSQGLSPSVGGAPASRCDFWREQAHLASNHCLRETGLGEGRASLQGDERQAEPPRPHDPHWGRRLRALRGLGSATRPAW